MEQVQITNNSKHESPACLDAMPVSLRHDWQVRNAMMRAVQCNEEAVRDITLELTTSVDVTLLRVAELSYPFCPPPVVATANSEALGENNNVLREFAFDAFEALDEYFGGESWGEWRILPFVMAKEDQEVTYNIGLFVDSVLE